MEFTRIEEATDWLLNQVNPIPRPDMTKMYQALEYMGNSHLGLPVLHITGTNGKGSVVAYLRDLFQSQGLNVGSFTSPHIERFNERISYNHEQISDEAVIRWTNRLKELNTYMETHSEYGRLIYFELFTILACLYFQEKKPDVCLIEAGIGGMHDCSNVLDGQVSVITSIGLDHAEMLGDTKEKVAYEKAGIIKPGRSAVTGYMEEGPLAVIDQWSHNHHAKAYHYDKEYQVSQVKDLGPHGAEFIFKSPLCLNESLAVKIAMIGEHQVHNAATALQAFILWMQGHHLEIDWSKALQALSQTHWIGRLEAISEQPLIYLDGAHNMEGLTALKEVVSHQFKDYQIELVYAGLRKKNQHDQVPLLLTFEVDQVNFTGFDHFESMELEDFQAILEQTDKPIEQAYHFIEDWPTWIDQYCHDHSGSDRSLLLITGSLYFVSQVREYILSQKLNG
ncbi:folylpolyglutamate synthase/dihydrofolate synthase family protein [Facklamia hominis]|uniref:bifunctional folylpolyglutamate synthase/dihydrofolate synthase n=1 Tax=Facklamia hominis TaxID=178214 RepID=UPI0029D4109E|nr:folylpolyglutamate synthase/dihydrofolate synthase family protein [Facklamia hominis]WPJ91564.1 folylpolyglutamate synthase/dihydrofolate synthase family protein [Facklamia hominis]